MYYNAMAAGYGGNGMMYNQAMGGAGGYGPGTGGNGMMYNNNGNGNSASNGGWKQAMDGGGNGTKKAKNLGKSQSAQAKGKAGDDTSKSQSKDGGEETSKSQSKRKSSDATPTVSKKKAGASPVADGESSTKAAKLASAATAPGKSLGPLKQSASVQAKSQLTDKNLTAVNRKFGSTLDPQAKVFQPALSTANLSTSPSLNADADAFVPGLYSSQKYPSKGKKETIFSRKDKVNDKNRDCLMAFNLDAYDSSDSSEDSSENDSSDEDSDDSLSEVSDSAQVIESKIEELDCSPENNGKMSGSGSAEQAPNSPGDESAGGSFQLVGGFTNSNSLVIDEDELLQDSRRESEDSAASAVDNSNIVDKDGEGEKPKAELPRKSNMSIFPAAAIAQPTPTPTVKPSTIGHKMINSSAVLSTASTVTPDCFSGSANSLTHLHSVQSSQLLSSTNSTSLSVSPSTPEETSEDLVEEDESGCKEELSAAPVDSISISALQLAEMKSVSACLDANSGRDTDKKEFLDANSGRDLSTACPDSVKKGPKVGAWTNDTLTLGARIDSLSPDVELVQAGDEHDVIPMPETETGVFDTKEVDERDVVLDNGSVLGGRSRVASMEGKKAPPAITTENLDTNQDYPPMSGKSGKSSRCGHEAGMSGLEGVGINRPGSSDSLAASSVWATTSKNVVGGVKVATSSESLSASEATSNASSKSQKVQKIGNNLPLETPTTVIAKQLLAATTKSDTVKSDDAQAGDESVSGSGAATTQPSSGDNSANNSAGNLNSAQSGSLSVQTPSPVLVDEDDSCLMPSSEEKSARKSPKKSSSFTVVPAAKKKAGSVGGAGGIFPSKASAADMTIAPATAIGSVPITPELDSVNELESLGSRFSRPGFTKGLLNRRPSVATPSSSSSAFETPHGTPSCNMSHDTPSLNAAADSQSSLNIALGKSKSTLLTNSRSLASASGSMESVCELGESAGEDNKSTGAGEDKVSNHDTNSCANDEDLMIVHKYSEEARKKCINMVDYFVEDKDMALLIEDWLALPTSSARETVHILLMSGGEDSRKGDKICSTLEALIRKRVLWYTPDIEVELSLFKKHFADDLRLDNPKVDSFLAKVALLKKAEDRLFEEAEDTATDVSAGDDGDVTSKLQKTKLQSTKSIGMKSASSSMTMTGGDFEFVTGSQAGSPARDSEAEGGLTPKVVTHAEWPAEIKDEDPMTKICDEERAEKSYSREVMLGIGYRFVLDDREKMRSDDMCVKTFEDDAARWGIRTYAEVGHKVTSAFDMFGADGTKSGKANAKGKAKSKSKNKGKKAGGSSGTNASQQAIIQQQQQQIQMQMMQMQMMQMGMGGGGFGHMGGMNGMQGMNGGFNNMNMNMMDWSMMNGMGGNGFNGNMGGMDASQMGGGGNGGGNKNGGGNNRMSQAKMMAQYAQQFNQGSGGMGMNMMGGGGLDQSSVNQIMTPSTTSWMAKLKAKKMESSTNGKTSEVEEKEAEEKRMKGLLNKLTLEKFDKVSEELISIICESKCNTRGIPALMAMLFTTATTQHHFVPIYTQLCVKIHAAAEALNDKEENGTALEEEIEKACAEAGVNDIEDQDKQKEERQKIAENLEATREKREKVNFKRILLNQCQQSFETYLAPPEGFDGLTGEDLYVAQVKYKTKMLGNIKLVGELLRHKMIASKIFICICDELVGNDYEQITAIETPARGYTGMASTSSAASGAPSDATQAGGLLTKPKNGLSAGAGERLETLAAFLETIGPELDDEAWQYHAYFEQVLHKIEIYSRWKKVPSRLRCLLQDVLDLRKDNWNNKKLSKKKLDAPTTLSKESKDLGLEQFPKGAGAQPLHNQAYAMAGADGVGASIYQQNMFAHSNSMTSMRTPSGSNSNWRTSTTSLPGYGNGGGGPNASPPQTGTPATSGKEASGSLGGPDPATQVERVLQTAFDKVEGEIKDKGVEQALEKISGLASSFGAMYKKLVPNAKVGKDVVARLIRKISSMRQKPKRIVFFKFLMSLTISGEIMCFCVYELLLQGAFLAPLVLN